MNQTSKDRVRFTLHDVQEITRRKLDIQQVARVVHSPDSVSLVETGRWAYAKRYDDAETGKEFVIRVIVERITSHSSVITAYRSCGPPVVFREVPVVESDEVGQNVIADYDAIGEIVSIEILRASRVVSDTDHVLYERSA